MSEWADYAVHKEARDLILRGPIDIIEAIQYDMAQRVNAVLAEDPAALNRAFRDYGPISLGRRSMAHSAGLRRYARS